MIAGEAIVDQDITQKFPRKKRLSFLTITVPSEKTTFSTEEKIKSG